MKKIIFLEMAPLLTKQRRKVNDPRQKAGTNFKKGKKVRFFSKAMKRKSSRTRRLALKNNLVSILDAGEESCREYYSVKTRYGSLGHSSSAD